jgi:hypothetical protein
MSRWITDDQAKAIREIASSLGRGETSPSNVECPKCGGGRQRESSFSVTRDESGTRLLYICFRAKCSFSGAVFCGVDDVARGEQPARPAPPKNRRRLQGAVEAVPTVVREYLQSRYRIREELVGTYGLQWNPSERLAGGGRLLIPILRYDGTRAGWIARRVDDRDEPKSLTYLEEGVEKAGLSWFRTVYGDTGTVLLVEDSFSAMRCAKYVDSVALLGTNLNLERFEEIRSAVYSPFAKFVMALDQDAAAKAAKFVRQLRWRADLNLMFLTKDLKDLTEPELQAKLKELEEVL